MTAAAWSVEAKKRAYRTDGTNSEGAFPSLRGAAAGIGREGERNRRFVGERRRDRLTAQQALPFVRLSSDGVAGAVGRPDDGL